jgi:cell division transport system ATP-binding protein
MAAVPGGAGPAPTGAEPAGVEPSSEATPLVAFEDVSLRYGGGPEILRNMSFRLAEGSFHFLIGPSGAGKSSLLNLLCLAMAPVSGRVVLFGRDLATLRRSELPAMRRRIGMVFQDFRLIEHLSVLDNVALPLRLIRAPENQVRVHVSELLAWVGLADHLHALPATLSGGQQQRVAIARAVIAHPRLVLADEPTGNVDDTVGTRLLFLLHELNKQGTTVVVATHNEGLVARFPHPQLRIGGGTLRAVAPAAA